MPCRSRLPSALPIGFVNGVGVVLLGVSPIVMTLAMNGILQGAALVYSNGTPAGFSSPLLRWFMTDHELASRRSSCLSRCSSSPRSLLLGRTPFGRRVYAIGNGERVRGSSGVTVSATLIGVYMLSRPLLGARRRAAHGLFRAGEPRHGRRISAALDRRRGRRRRADHGRARTLSRACSAACCC